LLLKRLGKKTPQGSLQPNGLVGHLLCHRHTPLV